MSEPGRIFIARDVLERCSLPDDTKRFLAERGLPAIFGVTDIEPWAFFRQANQLELYDYDDGPYYILADGEYAGILAVRAGNGEVVWIDEDDLIPVRLVNTSVQALNVFYELWHNLTRREDELKSDNAALKSAFESTRSRMQQADVSALADDEAFWSLVLEDAGYQLED